MYNNSVIIRNCLLCLTLFTGRTLAFTPASARPTLCRATSVRVQATQKPFAVIVQAEIQPDRMDEFLQLIETNAVETRKEPGCLRFDVLRSQEADNKFFFYELYDSPDAIDFHKAQPHYNLWADFKGSGGTISSTTFKADGEFLS